MNAIKLPVTAEKVIGFGMWIVTDAEGVTCCQTGESECLAREIALSLNCHDAMVEALEYYRDGGDDEGPCARAVLAKVEKLKSD